MDGKKEPETIAVHNLPSAAIVLCRKRRASYIWRRVEEARKKHKSMHISSSLLLPRALQKLFLCSAADALFMLKSRFRSRPVTESWAVSIRSGRCESRSCLHKIVWTNEIYSWNIFDWKIFLFRMIKSDHQDYYFQMTPPKRLHMRNCCFIK